ncbi:MAG: hypothetical protein LAO56_02870 [Acidobacteriia bacterium]|nr:hypothetical protein [Terriglobia bacterium]
MKSIRKFALATAFTVSSLSLFVSPAAAEAARGHFTLTQEVHWQNAVLPAGEYSFSMADDGPSEMLTIRKLSGNRTSYILLVQDQTPSQSTDLSRLVLVSRPAGTFVDRMELPEFGMTLHFKVPAGTVDVARLNASGATSSGK